MWRARCIDNLEKRKEEAWVRKGEIESWRASKVVS